jgi:hypothetical protein
MECGPACGCASTDRCLNRAVTERHALKVGQDVKEVNSWGMDCYTRRNIQDGTLRYIFEPMPLSTSAVLHVNVLFDVARPADHQWQNILDIDCQDPNLYLELASVGNEGVFVLCGCI